MHWQYPPADPGAELELLINAEKAAMVTALRAKSYSSIL